MPVAWAGRASWQAGPTERFREDLGRNERVGDSAAARPQACLGGPRKGEARAARTKSRPESRTGGERRRPSISPCGRTERAKPEGLSCKCLGMYALYKQRRIKRLMSTRGAAGCASACACGAGLCGGSGPARARRGFFGRAAWEAGGSRLGLGHPGRGGGGSREAGGSRWEGAGPVCWRDLEGGEPRCSPSRVPGVPAACARRGGQARRAGAEGRRARRRLRDRPAVFSGRAGRRGGPCRTPRVFSGFGNGDEGVGVAFLGPRLSGSGAMLGAGVFSGFRNGLWGVGAYN